MKHKSITIQVFHIIGSFFILKEKLKGRGEPLPANYVPSAYKMSSVA
jgi:hypothetical protein